MWLARNFPGLNLSVEDVEEMTPEQTAALGRAGRRVLDGESKERLMHTRIIATAAIGRRVNL